MKSIYIDENIHNKLKVLATLEKKPLARLVEEFLTKEVEKKMSDLPTELIQKLNASGGSFDFLSDEGENIYSLDDGDPI